MTVFFQIEKIIVKICNQVLTREKRCAILVMKLVIKVYKK